MTQNLTAERSGQCKNRLTRSSASCYECLPLVFGLYKLLEDNSSFSFVCLSYWSTMYKLALFTVIVVVCTAFPSFRGRIPNGDKVPNPCPSGGIWEAVGHFNSSGGGDTNPFGDVST
ncbi:hypothetical protein Btru_072970 [Bulinus truncatus]|nr:hypothetical protein Btru_072970 [Bulinus truncatus]